MRKFASFAVAGTLAVSAFGMPAVIASVARAWTPPQPDALEQIVDRSRKGDRLPLPAAVEKRQAPSKPAKPHKMIVGCEPAFSPLSASRHANIAARCVA